MSLMIVVYDPCAEESDHTAHYSNAAGFEIYREKLWGTPAIEKRSPLLFALKHSDVRILPGQFVEFEQQVELLQKQTKQVIREIEPNRTKPRDRRAAYLMIRRLRDYVKSFQEGLVFARAHGSQDIWIG
ncbi:MAG: hypothetical protein AAGH92_06850 [Planctomycetota bacterium]